MGDPSEDRAWGPSVRTPRPFGPDVETVAQERRQLGSFSRALQAVLLDDLWIARLAATAGLRALACREMSPLAVANLFDEWIGHLTDVRRNFDAVRVPPFLASAAGLMSDSLVECARAAQAGRQACVTTNEKREAAVERSRVLLKRSDALMAEAEAEIERHRRRLGPHGGEDAASL